MSMSMYNFQHLLEQTDKHDVIFYVEEGQQQLCSAGFMKMLLAGVSEMWRAREEGSWIERTDEQGRILHKVDLPVELASDVLRSLQYIVFTGALPANVEWRVLCTLAKLSDAEVMPHVLDIAATELKQRVPECMSPDKAAATILWLDQHLWHIASLQQWVADTCETLSRPFGGQVEVITALLDQLPANSMAAFGVVKAGWHPLGNEFPDCSYVTAIERHKQIYRLPDLMRDITHKLFGSPEAVLQSPESIQQFNTMLEENSTSRGNFWSWYVDKPDRLYLELLHQVPPSSLSYFNNRFCGLSNFTLARLMEDVNILQDMSSQEMKTLVLSLLEHTTEISIRSLVQALYHSKQQAEAAQQQLQESERNRKRRRVTIDSC